MVTPRRKRDRQITILSGIRGDDGTVVWDVWAALITDGLEVLVAPNGIYQVVSAGTRIYDIPHVPAMLSGFYAGIRPQYRVEETVPGSVLTSAIASLSLSEDRRRVLISIGNFISRRDT